MANLLYIEVNNTLQTLVLEELPLSGDVIIIPRDQVGLHKDLSVPVRIDESGKVTVCSLNLGDEYSGGDKVEVRNKKDIITTPVDVQSRGH